MNITVFSFYGECGGLETSHIPPPSQPTLEMEISLVEAWHQKKKKKAKASNHFFSRSHIQARQVYWLILE